MKLSIDEKNLLWEFLRLYYIRLKESDCSYDSFYWSLSLMHSTCQKLGISPSFVHEAHTSDEVARIVRIKANREELLKSI